MSDEPSAIDDIRATLREIVADGLVRRPDGVHLTFLGSEFARRKKVPFEQYINVLTVQQLIEVPTSARKMIPFIETYCADIFEIDKEPVGSETIRLKSSTDLNDSNAPTTASVANHRYSKSIWAAFVRPLPVGYRRFISLDTLGFSDLKRKPATGIWLEVKRSMITETPLEQAIDGPLVQARIADWAAENQIAIDSLVDRSAGASFNRPGIADLLRIIAVLPADVAARWMVPADVLQHLDSGSRRVG